MEEDARKRRQEERKNALKMNRSYSERHHQSAMAKITKAAARYALPKNPPYAIPRGHSSTGGVPMPIFREFPQSGVRKSPVRHVYSSVGGVP